MQSFLGEAGKGGNALKQVSQREGVDNSLFRDRLAPQAGSSSSAQQPFRPGFAQAPPAPGQLQQHPPQPFNLSRLSAALADPRTTAGPAHAPYHHEQVWNSVRPAHQPPPHLQHHSPHGSARSSPGPGFAAEFHARQQHQAQPQASGWAESFNSPVGKGKGRALEPAQPAPQPAYTAQYGHQPMMPYQPSFTPMYAGYGAQQYQPPPLQQHQPQMQHDVAASSHDMDAAFEKAMSDWKAMGDAHKEQEQARAQPSSVADHVDVSAAAARQETAALTDDGIEDRGTSKGQLDQVWDSLKSDAARQDKLAEWENGFSQFTQEEGDQDLFDTLNGSLNHPDIGRTPLEEQMTVEEGFFHPHGDGPQTTIQDSDLRPGQSTHGLGPERSRAYEFTLPNRFDSMEAQDAWSEAQHLLGSGGSLTDATLLLETYIRRGTDLNLDKPAARQLEAWSLLGRVHAMNEKEEKALLAFDEGRQAIPGNEQSGAIGEMLTNLAISHVNESSDLEALQVLHQFLAIVHPAHAGQAPMRETVEARNNPWAVHQEVTDQYLALARAQYNDKGIVDPDVQVGLGTLYYMMGDYGEARDCWTAALGERPDDYLLWNRLGATLANGGSPEEAVDAYRRALELKPMFTRATFNLGVACLNIGVHKEAAEHFLAALSLHARDAEKEQRDSTPIWLTLRRALIAMDMLELSGKARPGADLELFRQAGFEF